MYKKLAKTKLNIRYLSFFLALTIFINIIPKA